MNTPEKDTPDKLQQSIDRMLEIIGNKPGVFHIEMLHDDGCPALRTHRMIDCTCSPIIRRMRTDKHSGAGTLAS